MSASRTLDDAVRQYLSESGGSTDRRAPVIRSANRAIRLRNAAELIADVSPPPLSVYPRIRDILEAHTEVVCERLAGTDDRDYPPISDDFVLALRSEATGDALSVSAALPLVAVAAILGELELLYPTPEPPLPVISARFPSVTERKRAEVARKRGGGAARWAGRTRTGLR